MVAYLIGRCGYGFCCGSGLRMGGLSGVLLAIEKQAGGGGCDDQDGAQDASRHIDPFHARWLWLRWSRDRMRWKWRWSERWALSRSRAIRGRIWRVHHFALCWRCDWPHLLPIAYRPCKRRVFAIWDVSIYQCVIGKIIVLNVVIIVIRHREPTFHLCINGISACTYLSYNALILCVAINQIT
jgi:hypothetical protein